MARSQSPPLPFSLDWRSSLTGLSLSKRISEGLLRDIRRGRFQAGDKLPSSRSLARSLQVHRNTVLAAFDELTQQGYLQTQPGRGTFVSRDLPKVTSYGDKKHAPRSQARLRLAPSPTPVLVQEQRLERFVLGAIPDLRQVPRTALARAYRAALKHSPDVLDYQSELGQERFLKTFAHYLAEQRGVVAQKGEMLVTRGSQQALHLAALALARPKSVIAVEAAGYPPAWESFRIGGAELAPIKVDKKGLVVADLAALCEERDVTAVYVTPHHQYPTTVTMSAGRRMALLALARRKRFVIIEDDYDHEFHFTSRPVLPLASMDEGRVVLHVGTLSKVLSPGLRLGYAVGQKRLIESMASFRRYIDRQGDHTTELALAFMIEDGELQAHIRKMHRLYASRREAFLTALRKRLPESLSFDEPSGGLAVWAQVHQDLSARRWQEEAQKLGLYVQAARTLFFDKRNRPFLRLAFARHTEDELLSAVELLVKSRPQPSATAGRKR